MQARSRPSGLLRTHALLIVAVLLLTMVGALAVSLTRPSHYVSVSRVVVQAEQVKTGIPLPPDMGTEREIALSGEVAQAASDELDLSADTASEKLQVEVPVDTNVLEFRYSAETAERAFHGAQVFTRAYVDYRNGPRSSIAQIITPPWVPSETTGPNLYLVLAVSLLVGLGLGIAIAYAWDRLSPRLRDIADVEAYTGLPVLAAIPRLPTAPGERIIVGSQRAAIGAEAYGYLTARLLSLLQQHEAHSVVITSPSSGAGKTTVTLNLAKSLALAGKDTIVLCADPRETTMHMRAGVMRWPGLQELLREKTTLEDTLHDTELEGLRILPAGGSVRAPRTALNVRKLAGILDELKQEAEVVLIEAPSVLGTADTAILAEHADLTLLVVDLRRGRRVDASVAVHTLSHVESRLPGCVVNDPGRKPQPPERSLPGAFGRKGWSKVRDSLTEEKQHAPIPSSLHSTGNEAAARLRASDRSADADATSGRSGHTDDRVADLQ